MKKRVLATIAVSVISLTGLLGFAGQAHATASYCPYVSSSYLAVFNYPTGSYWQSQIHAYPDYYTANNAYYLANFHC